MNQNMKGYCPSVDGIISAKTNIKSVKVSSLEAQQERWNIIAIGMHDYCQIAEHGRIIIKPASVPHESNSNDQIMQALWLRALLQ